MTYRAESCPCCRGTSWVTYPAIIAPFVAEYALDERPRRTRLVECRGCAFRFFEDRLTDEEVARLYASYRGERYFEVRHRHEPWYTRRANDSTGDGPARRSTIERFVRGSVERVGDLLDFGGDRGQFIPEGIADRRFVYEISGVEPVAGVELIATNAALEDRRFDLVLLCHVLEHASEPRALLERIRRLLRSDESLLYVEVPFERPALRWLGRGAWFERWLDGVRRVRFLLTAVDFYSTAFRHKLEVVPPLGFVKLHEHINFFGEDSLRAVLRQAGLEPVRVGVERVTTARGTFSVLCALAKPAAPGA